MNCPRCQFELPDNAKFCPGCGNRMDAAPAAPVAPPGPPAAAPPRPSEARAHPPSAAASDLAGAAEFLPRGPDGEQITLTPAELARALDFACQRAHKERPALELSDLEIFYAAGAEIGIGRGELDASLHAVALEKGRGIPLDHAGRGVAGEVFRVHTIDSIPLADLTTRGEKIRAALLAVTAFVLLAVGIVLAAIYYQSTQEPRPQAATPAAEAPRPPPPPMGIIDGAALSDSAQALTAEVTACAGDSLAALELPQTVRVSALIGMDGRAREPALEGDRLDDGLKACVEQALSAHLFPKPEGAPVQVDLPLLLEPAAAKGPAAKKKPKAE